MRSSLPLTTPPPIELTGELSALLGGAYESFLRVRLERRHGQRGKVQARGLVSFLEMVNEMVNEAGGANPKAMWVVAITELDRDRCEIEADVLEHRGHIEVEHEWAAFLEWWGRFEPRPHDGDPPLCAV